MPRRRTALERTQHTCRSDNRLATSSPPVHCRACKIEERQTIRAQRIARLAEAKRDAANPPIDHPIDARPELQEAKAWRYFVVRFGTPARRSVHRNLSSYDAHGPQICHTIRHGTGMPGVLGALDDMAQRRDVEIARMLQTVQPS